MSSMSGVSARRMLRENWSRGIQALYSAIKVRRSERKLLTTVGLLYFDCCTCTLAAWTYHVIWSELRLRRVI